MAPADPSTAHLERAAAGALVEWGLAHAPLTLVSRAENVVFRVDAPDGRRFALRLHRPGYHDYDELVSEHRWTEALLDAGVDVPVARRTRDGRPYATVAVGPHGEARVVGMVDWVEGAPMSSRLGDDPSPDLVAECYHRLGAIAASLHEHGARWTPPDGFRRHAFDVDGLTGERPFWGRFWEHPELGADDRALLGRLRHRVRERLTAYGSGRGTYGLIHADLHPGNVIVGESRLHLIDFDDGGFGWHQYDFATALFSLRASPHLARAREAMVAGYRTLRRLDDHALDQLPLFLLIRALALIGWIADRPEIPRKPALADLVDTARRLAHEVLGEA